MQIHLLQAILASMHNNNQSPGRVESQSAYWMPVAPSSSNGPTTPQQNRGGRPCSCCDWHGPGNLDKHAANDLWYNECILSQNSPAFGNWCQHIDRVLFYNKPNWRSNFCTRIKPHMHRGVAEILVHRQGSSSNRMFVFRCKTCSDSAAVLYAPWKPVPEVNARLLELFDFLKMDRPRICA